MSHFDGMNLISHEDFATLAELVDEETGSSIDFGCWAGWIDFKTHVTLIMEDEQGFHYAAGACTGTGFDYHLRADFDMIDAEYVAWLGETED